MRNIISVSIEFNYYELKRQEPHICILCFNISFTTHMDASIFFHSNNNLFLMLYISDDGTYYKILYMAVFGALQNDIF